MHYIKAEWVDEGKFDHVSHFTFDDNPSLTEKWKEQKRKEFSGVFFERYILGKWAVAEGAIFPTHHKYEGDINEEKIDFYSIFVDPAQGGIYAALFVAKLKNQKNKWIILDEYYHDNHKKPLSDTEHANAIKQKALSLHKIAPIKEGRMPQKVDVDYENVQAMRELAKVGLRTRNAIKMNKVEISIPSTRYHLENRNVLIHPRCKELLKELSGWAWDAKAQEKGLDIPKSDLPNHGIDCLLYMTRRYLPFSKAKAIKVINTGAIG